MKTNTGKKVSLVAMATLAVAGSAFAVQAEEQESTLVDKSEFQSTKADVTAADVESAKNELDKVEQQTTQQASVVDSKTTELKSAEEDLKVTEKAKDDAQMALQKATPEAIAETKKTIVGLEKDLERNDNDAQGKQALLEAHNKDIKEQETTVSKAEEKAQEAGKTRDKAKEAVELVKKGLNSQSIEKAKEDADVATQNVDTAQKALSEAKKEYKAALESDKKREEHIQEKKAELVSKEGNADNAQSLVEKLKQDKSSALSEQQQAKSALAKAQNKLDSINSFTISPEYKAYLKQYATSPAGSQASKEALQQLANMNASLYAANSYKGNPDEDSKMLDLNNLSKDEQETLSLFAADLINQVREQMGVKKLTVSPGAIKLAGKVADNYVADNWGWKELTDPDKGHNNTAINKAAKEEGLEYAPANDFQIYENLYNRKGESNRMSMSSAKRFVFESVRKFLFNGKEWEHAKSVSGIKDRVEYLGIDFSVTPESTNLHALFVPSVYIKSNSSFDRTVIDNPNTKEAVEKVYKKAEETLKAADLKVAETSSKLDTAEKELKKAQEAVEQAQNELQNALGVELQGEVKKANLEAVKQAYEDAKKAKEDADLKVANFKAYVEKEKAELAKLEQELEALSKEADKANASVGNEKEKLKAFLEKANKVAEELKDLDTEKATTVEKLSAAKETLKKYESAPEDYRKASEKLVEIQGKVAQLKNELEKEVEALNTLNALLGEKKALYAELKAQFDIQNITNQLNQAQTGHYPGINTFNTNNEAPKTEAPKAVEKGTVKLSVNYADHQSTESIEKVSKANTYLPSTGQVENAYLLFAGLMILGALVYKLKPAKKGE